MALLLGYDVGSSFVKAALLDAEEGSTLARAASPEEEMAITAPRPGWAEQHPDLWWEHLCRATEQLGRRAPGGLEAVKAVGISYQMHGLVLVDDHGAVLRPAIIWCDSRAVETGEGAARAIGHRACLERLLNLPGNFTASKLKWVKDQEPAVWERIHKFMLPGDYVAFRMTGEIRTTPSGLSEGILWDFLKEEPAGLLLDHYGIPREMLPGIVPVFAPQGSLTPSAAGALGLPSGIPVSYRAGDQPNNAFALNVLDPGEAAATAGTSGVVYGVADQGVYDFASRVNTFLHVNHAPGDPRYGVLLCVNGTGILMRWMRNLLAAGGTRMDYHRMNALAEEAPPGAGGVQVFPFGNGAERTLGNRDVGAAVRGLNFNVHGPPHLLRAVQEGIVFALNLGVGILRDMGLEVRLLRAGRGNLFLSPLFRRIFATVTDAVVELYDTEGAEGAARGAGLGAGVYRSREEAFRGLRPDRVVEPVAGERTAYAEAFSRWTGALERLMA